jgi:hypothetical protein
MRHVVIVSVFAMLSCTTTETAFRGSAKVPNGAAGCQARCSSYGMELAGMVALGNYSDGCICEVPGRRSGASAAAGSGAAVAAAMEEIRLQQQRQNNDWLVQPQPPVFLPPLVRDEAKEGARCAGDRAAIATAAAIAEPQ